MGIRRYCAQIATAIFIATTTASVPSTAATAWALTMATKKASEMAAATTTVTDSGIVIAAGCVTTTTRATTTGTCRALKMPITAGTTEVDPTGTPATDEMAATPTTGGVMTTADAGGITMTDGAGETVTTVTTTPAADGTTAIADDSNR